MQKITSKPELSNQTNAVILRKIAYVTAGLLFVLWGMFFIEHLAMFKSAEAASLPTVVWVAQILHGLLLVGYMLVYKWPRLACVVINVTAIPFFALTADQNAVLYTLISLIPVYLLGYLWWKEIKATRFTTSRG